MKAQIRVTDDIAACQAVRYAVFVQEQGVPIGVEQDGQDDSAHHILACVAGRPVGAARILITGNTGKIGRVCVLADHRRQGLGAALIRACIAHLQDLPDLSRAELGAQTHALPFYEKLGFIAFGPEYTEINTPHRMMERTL